MEEAEEQFLKEELEEVHQLQVGEEVLEVKQEKRNI